MRRCENAGNAIYLFTPDLKIEDYSNLVNSFGVPWPEIWVEKAVVPTGLSTTNQPIKEGRDASVPIRCLNHMA